MSAPSISKSRECFGRSSACALGLSLAVVANWGPRPAAAARRAGLASYQIVVHAARKPAPDGLHDALGKLQVDPARALHIGDDDADRDAAAAAGMQFAPAPVPAAMAAVL
jgi:phosphoglycolate phosphatase-like HAD superfamily hydrolase